MRIIVFGLAIACLVSMVACTSTRDSNSDGMTNDKSLGDLLRWGFGREKPEPVQIDLSTDYKSYNLYSPEPYLIWIGHATFLLNTGDARVLFDPVFSDRASPFSMVGPKRIIPPAMDISELPNVHLVLISHNHYDHLDQRSLIGLKKNNPKAKFLVPKGDKALLTGMGIENVFEFNWWESIAVRNLELTFTPAQHWSSRGLFDRNHSLWGSWFVRDANHSFFHAGDTGYSRDFVEIREKLGDVDYAMIPIGAYDPRWFMSYQHVNPEEAVTIAKDIGADVSFGMHWGTFILTDEPIMEPKQRLERAAYAEGVDFRVPVPGEVNKIN